MVTSMKITTGAALLTMFILLPVAPEWQVRPTGHVAMGALQNAYAREGAAFLLQAESAMSVLDRQMATLTRRADKDDTSAPCSFAQARKAFLEKEQILRQKIQGARESASITSWAKPEIDTALTELREAYAQATLCYR